MTVRLFGWGANSYGQLSQGHSNDLAFPTEIIPSGDFDPSEIEQIAAGGGHVMILTLDHKLFACGSNSNGQLGIEKTQNVDKFVQVPTSGEVFLNIACGWDFTLMIDVMGKLFSCGSNAFGQLGCGTEKKYCDSPCALQEIESKVEKISAGLRHSLALTVNGKLWSWGSGKYGQLGNINQDGTPLKISTKPIKVSALNGTRIKDIACGADHSAALAYDGQLFVWGRNNKGQLGQDPSNMPISSTPIRVKVNFSIMEVKSGWTHFICRSDDEVLYSWGRSDYGQLGRKTESEKLYCFKPSPIDVQPVCCGFEAGPEHNIMWRGNKVWTWGWNEHGICGTGDEINVTEPQLLKSRLYVDAVLYAVAGGGTTYLLTC